MEGCFVPAICLGADLKSRRGTKANPTHPVLFLQEMGCAELSTESSRWRYLMSNQLNAKVALVTGGSSGIGRASAQMFAGKGAKVVIADVNAEGGEETVSNIKQAGGEALFLDVDVSKASDVEAMVRKVVETYGGLNCAFNNAGIGEGGSLIHEHPEDAWDRVLSVNLKGVYLCMKYEIPQMLKQGKGAIVNMASVGGLVGRRGASPAYIASKHGVVGLTKTVALEYAEKGIRVNAVCPGAIRTPLLEMGLASRPGLEEGFLAKEPIGRFGSPDEIAEAVVWLCSDAASFVTGHAMAVDGGWVAQ